MFSNIFNRFLNLASEQKVSDLYLFPGAFPFAKKEGNFINLEKMEIVNIGLIQEFITSILNKDEEKQLLKEKDFFLARDFGNIRLFIYIFFQKENPSLIFRFIYPEFKTLEQLNLPTIVKNFTQLEKGLIFITGPRNSGKSTLLAALINQINKNCFKHIATIEDPIKTIFAPLKSIIEQREFNKDIFSFFNGLASLKKRKADVVVLSPLPLSPEVIVETLLLAETGKLVFASLETILFAPQLVERLVNLSREKEELIKGLLSINLKAIINLRLLPRKGGGMVMVSEILINNQAISAAIRDKKLDRLNTILQMSESEGMISLDKSLSKLVKNEEISLDQALKNCFSEETLKITLRE